VVGECNDTDFLAANVVDDAVWKLPYWKAAPAVSPGRAKLWMDTKKLEHSFELDDELEGDFGITLASIEQRPFG